MENEKKKFYKTTWFLIVLGIFLPVIAIIVLWLAQKERSQKQKVVFTVIFAVWALIGLVSNGAKNKSPKVEQPAPSVVETTIQEETETISESEETTVEETNEEQSTEAESNGETDSNSETVSETVDADSLIATVKEVIKDEVNSDEKITNVSLQDKNLIITVDLSGADTEYVSARNLALSRIYSITDAILDLDDSYYNSWETVTLDFGSNGTAVLDKSMVKDEGYGKFFNFKDEVLKDEKSTEAAATESSTTTSNKDFISEHETDIVVAAKMSLDNYLSDYKMSLAPQNWVIAKFDESETTVIAMTDITYNGQKGRYIYVGTLNINAGKVVSATPHYLEANGVVLGNDGYCDEVFDKIKSLTQ